MQSRCISRGPLWSLAMLGAMGCGNAAKSSATAAVDQNTSSNESPTKAQSTDPLQRIARAEGPEFIEILEVRATDDDLLLYCTGVRGLQVVDIKDPSDMKLVAELQSSKYSHEQFSRCQHVAIDGNTVYFTNRGDMIQSTPFITGYDLSASPPKEILNYTADKGTFEGIAAHDDKLYVAMHDRGLAVMKRTKNGSLRELGVATGFKAAWGVAIHDDYAYVADASGSLGVVDISDPRQPTKVATVEVGGSAQSVVALRDHAYVAAGAAGLVVVDIATPRKPKIISETDTNGSALQVSVSGHNAYIANWNDARVYDVENVAKPELIATKVIKTDSALSRVLGIGSIRDLAFVGEWTGMFAYQLRADMRTPDIHISNRRIDFGRTKPGNKVKRKLLMSNEGREPLEISSAELSGSGFSSAAIDAFTLAPGETKPIEVSFAPTTKKSHKGKLTFASNDPDESETSVMLRGNPKGVGLGDEAPEVALRLIDGGKWKLAEQRGKTVLLAYFATF